MLSIGENVKPTSFVCAQFNLCHVERRLISHYRCPKSLLLPFFAIGRFSAAVPTIAGILAYLTVTEIKTKITAKTNRMFAMNVPISNLMIAIPCAVLTVAIPLRRLTHMHV